MIKKLLSVLAVILIASIAFASCGNTEKENPVSTPSDSQSAVTEIGEGEKSFEFEVIDLEDNATKYIIRTDKETVGEALEELGLIKGTEGDFGIYVNEVNGILADYNITGTYWAFYINGAYALTGADVTPITEGESYAFKVEKG